MDIYLFELFNKYSQRGKMFHGIKNSYLYSAKKINVQFKKETETESLYGTGFFIAAANNQSFLVTNRHVIDPGYSAPKYRGFILNGLAIESNESIDQSGLQLEFKNVSVQKAIIGYDENPNNDVACLTNLSLSEDLTIRKSIGYNLLADEEWINTKLTVCDSIAYPGYPEWFDHQKNIPIFRMGTIASDPRTDYCCQKDEPSAARIAYEGFSSSGSSGSPVFATQKGFPVGKGLQAPENFFRETKLIGINAGHFPSNNGHSGISYFYKSSVIKNIIDKMMKENSLIQQ